MRAFVAGATGYTGREVVRILCERGVETIAHVRPDSSQLDHWRTTFQAMGATVDTTPWEEDAFSKNLATCLPDRVFALLGTTRARKGTSKDPANETYMAIDYGLSAMLLRAAKAAPSKPGFVYLSSYGVKPNSPSSYIQARHRLEEELRGSSLKYLIVRPAFISGDDRDDSRPAERIGSVVSDGFLKGLSLLGLGEAYNRFASMNATTLASGMVSAGLEDFKSGEVDAAEIRRRASL